MITLQNVSKTYNRGKKNAYRALSGVSMEIADGELVAVTGKSGAGKSTVLHILAGISGCEEGEYRIGGISVKNLPEKKLAEVRSEKIGIVMQDYALVEDFTAMENVLLPLDFSGKKKKERKKLAGEALAAVDMEAFADKPVSELSGGQKQRVAIARAVANNPDVILADEPTGALDTANAEGIMRLFEMLHEQGKTVVIVTHDKELAARCERQIELKDGRVVSG